MKNKANAGEIKGASNNHCIVGDNAVLVKKERKKGSGGKRTGAGAKPKHGEAKTKTSFRMRSDILRSLKKIDNYTEFVETAIIEKFDRDGIKIG